MPLLRTCLVGVLIVSSAIGSSSIVAAQDQAEPMAPAYFTYTVAEPADWDEGRTSDPGAAVTELRDARVIDVPLDASDPRVSGLLSSTLNVDTIEGDVRSLGRGNRADAAQHAEGGQQALEEGHIDHLRVYIWGLLGSIRL